MKFIPLIFIIMIIGCGYQTNQKNDKMKGKEMTPDAWSEDVYKIYEKSINELDKILSGPPQFSEKFKNKILIFKDSIIIQLIEFGKIRNEMIEIDRKIASSKLGLRMDRIIKNPAWNRIINEKRLEYGKIDKEFDQLIMSFNIITQYAQFELLEKQEPEEAKRWSVSIKNVQ